MTPRFQAFSIEHAAPVALFCAATIALTLPGLRKAEPWRARSAKILAVVLVGYYAVETVLRMAVVGDGVMRTLPFEMCSALFFISAYGLWTGNQVALDVMWFWTMSGPIHALITPTPRAGYPHLLYFLYFVSHGLLLSTSLYGAIALRRSPRPGGVRRAFAALIAFIAIVAVIDIVTGQNYVYLRHKPPSPTLVDALGPWPLYTLSGIGVALISFLFWSVPWVIARKTSPAKGGTRVILHEKRSG